MGLVGVVGAGGVVVVVVVAGADMVCGVVELQCLGLGIYERVRCRRR